MPIAPDPRYPLPAGPQQTGYPVFSKAALNHMVRQRVGKLPVVGQAPQPSPMQQAQALVQSELAPLYAQITGGYTSEAQHGAQAIQALTDQYQKLIAQQPHQLAGIYSGAAQGVNAANTALADRLSGSGSGTDQLAAALSALGKPDQASPIVQQFQDQARHSGNAVYATGTASLDQLLQQGANAQAYAAKQPGIATLAGGQNLAGFMGQVGAAEQKSLGDLAVKQPGLVNSAYGTFSAAQSKRDTIDAANARFNVHEGDLIDIANQKHGDAVNAHDDKVAATKQAHLDAVASAKSLALYRKGELDAGAAKLAQKKLEDVFGWAAKYGTDGAGHLSLAGATLIAQATKTDPKDWIGQNVGDVKPPAAPAVKTFSSGGNEWSFDPATGTTTKLTDNPAPAGKPPSVRTFSSGGQEWSFDPSTGATTQLTHNKVTPKAAGSAGGATAGEWLTLVKDTNATVAKGVTAAAPQQHPVEIKNPDGSVTTKFVPVPGTGSSPVQYQEALANAIAGGPDTPRWHQKATAIVNAHYAMGENGRPYEGRQATVVARQLAAEAFRLGLTQEKALEQGRATGVIPDSALIPALAAVYRRGRQFGAALDKTTGPPPFPTPASGATGVAKVTGTPPKPSSTPRFQKPAPTRFATKPPTYVWGK